MSTLRPCPAVLRSACFAALVLIAAPSAFAQTKYLLSVPAQPNLTSQAIVSANEILLTDANGARFQYMRSRALDDITGQYRAYSSRQAGQAIRWPINNRGRFMIGDLTGQNWRASRMTIQQQRGVPPVIGVPGTPPIMTPPGPSIIGPGPGPLPLPGGAAVPGPRTPSNQPTAVPQPVILNVSGVPTASWIDDRGRLILASMANGQWGTSVVPVRERLAVGGYVGLSVDRARRVEFTTVSANGRMIQVNSLGNVRQIAGLPALTPGSLFAIDSATGEFHIVDGTGRVIGYDPVIGQMITVDPNPNVFLPGSPLLFLNARRPTIYGVDARGILVEYVKRSGRWQGPIPLNQGLMPGGRVSFVRTIPGQAAIASVAANGQLRILQNTGAGWVAAPRLNARFHPGAPVSMSYINNALQIFAVNRGGQLLQIASVGGSPFTATPLLSGFNHFSPVAFAPGAGHGVLFDAFGRPVFATWTPGGWVTSVLAPGFAVPQRILKREVIANPPLPPVEIVLTNSSNEELIVQFHDRTDTPHEVRIPPRGRTVETVQRDSGGFIEETWTEVIPGQVAQDVRRIAIPPESWQTVVVYANRTTYKYIDRRKDKPAQALKDFDLNSPVSLGVLDLPPGPLLRDGSTFDVYRLAKQNRNPGGVIFFAPPNTLPEKPANPNSSPGLAPVPDRTPGFPGASGPGVLPIQP